MMQISYNIVNQKVKAYNTAAKRFNSARKAYLKLAKKDSTQGHKALTEVKKRYLIAIHTQKQAIYARKLYK